MNSDSHWGTEDRLMMLAARSRVSSALAADIRALIQQGVDWNRLLTLVHAHGVHPIVAQTLLTHAADLIPPQTVTALRTFTHRALGRNLQMLSIWEQIVKQCHTASIPMVCLKGLALTVEGYGGLAVRSCNDLDLLLPPSQLNAACRLLRQNGFSPIFPELNDEERAYFVSVNTHHDVLFHTASGLSVELHWQLGTERPESDLSQTVDWQHPRSVRVEGLDLPCLPRETTVLFQAMHAAAHGWNCLRHLCDFHETIQGLHPVQWEVVTTLADQYKVSTALCVSALLCSEYFNSEIPAPVQRLIEKYPQFLKTAFLVNRHLKENIRDGTFRIPSFLLRWRIQPGFKQRLAHLGNILRPCIYERRLLRLPRPLWFFYYLIRPPRLLMKHASLLFRKS